MYAMKSWLTEGTTVNLASAAIMWRHVPDDVNMETAVEVVKKPEHRVKGHVKETQTVL